MFELFDMWGDRVVIGDFVYASRPSGNGSSIIDFCKVKNITKNSVSLLPVHRDGRDKEQHRYGHGPCTLTKSHGSDNCRKIVKAQSLHYMP